MVEVLKDLLASFIQNMNEELTKPFSTLKFFMAIEVMANSKAQGHNGIPIEFFLRVLVVYQRNFYNDYASFKVW